MKELISLARLLPFTFLLLLLNSCAKENLEPELPPRLGLDNWEEFVHAPQEVIDELMDRERMKTMRSGAKQVPLNPVQLASSQKSGAPLSGRVQAWDMMGWRNIAGVLVDGDGSSTLSTGTQGPINYTLPNVVGPQKCLSYATPAINGISTLDLVLITRHLLDIQHFSNWEQMSAADANNDGEVNETDVGLIQQVVIGASAGFLQGDLRFVPEINYQNLQAIWTTHSIYIEYDYGNCHPTNDFRTVKVGDVSGDFLF